MTSPLDCLRKFKTITERTLRVSCLCLQPLFEFLPGPVTILLTDMLAEGFDRCGHNDAEKNRILEIRLLSCYFVINRGQVYV